MTTTRYTYNGDGQRVKIDDGSTVRRFLYDGQNVLQEFNDSTGATLATYTNEPAGYGRPVSQNRSGTTRYYHYDGLGSTRALSNDAGTVTDTYVYDAFGTIKAQTGTTTNPYRWVGQLGYYYDTERSAYHLRARMYSPALARFLSRDPLAGPARKDGSVRASRSGIKPSQLKLVRTSRFVMDGLVRLGCISRLVFEDKPR
jgi:RHS repeat-associated protein